MNLDELTVRPEWRTGTVVGLCLAMRESQDFTQAPILADALQDAGCDNEKLLDALRAPYRSYAFSTGLVALALSAETAEAVEELVAFERGHDCPGYETLVNAAAGHHDENNKGDGYNYSEHDEEFLHFNGADAHGDIPPRFWELVQKVTGKNIPDDDRAEYFSCSC